MVRVAKILIKMKRIGITGQHGFIGRSISDRLHLSSDDFEIVPFDKTLFNSDTLLQKWVKECDIIIHLAALNRHSEPEQIYETNVRLVQQLLEALRTQNHCPHLIFTSSTQEANSNTYGKSKLEGRDLIRQWGVETGSCVTCLIVPNVFGPFGKPFYNSVIGTFSYQLCNNITPNIDKDSELKLIYVHELVDIIIEIIRSKTTNSEFVVPHTAQYCVSDILAMLTYFKEVYFAQGHLPRLTDSFSLNLFNTFRSYINHSEYFPAKLRVNTDHRGSFTELLRLEQGGQVSFSTTHAGITRGNHFHTRKIERFAVIKGKARIQMRKFNTNEVLSFDVSGDEPAYVDMPIWYTHNITNTGEEELVTVFWINEMFDPSNPDTYFETV